MRWVHEVGYAGALGSDHDGREGWLAAGSAWGRCLVAYGITSSRVQGVPTHARTGLQGRQPALAACKALGRGEVNPPGSSCLYRATCLAAVFPTAFIPSCPEARAYLPPRPPAPPHPHPHPTRHTHNLAHLPAGQGLPPRPGQPAGPAGGAARLPHERRGGGWYCGGRVGTMAVLVEQLAFQTSAEEAGAARPAFRQCGGSGPSPTCRKGSSPTCLHSVGRQPGTSPSIAAIYRGLGPIRPLLTTL